MTAYPWEGRVSKLEGAYEQVADRLNSMDHRLETIEQKIDAKTESLRSDLGEKIDGLRRDMLVQNDGLRREFTGRFDQLQWRGTALILGSWVTMMLAIFFRH